jgi:3-deoxy-manno-octulosonate cytidylyltransferase (CMP-KDO synthetase)
MMPKTVIIIPSRIGSTRLPEKPLQMIGEYTMIEHVVHKALESECGEVFVATDSWIIGEKASIAGAIPIMVTKDVQTGTDRIWAALKEIEKAISVDYIINLQGDLPLVSPKIIFKIFEVLQTTKADIVTPVIKTKVESVNNPSNVKAIRALDNTALYFSRNMIPHGAEWYWHHIGIYGFKRDALKRFVKLPQSHTEIVESLEQLRALENGMKIELCEVKENVVSVDTSHDLKAVRNLYEKIYQIV